MCFTLPWLAHFLIWLVIVCVIVAILRIWVLPMLATLDPRIVATVNILIWAVVVIYIIYFCVELLMCAGGGGFGFPSAPAR